MNLLELFKNIKPFVMPYKWLVLATLILTLIGSFMAQVNAIVLDWTVDSINNLIETPQFAWDKAVHILTIISAVLLGKEVLSALITFAQRFFGEKMRIYVSKDLAQAVIEKVLTFRVAFFSMSDNNCKRKCCTGRFGRRGMLERFNGAEIWTADCTPCY